MGGQRESNRGIEPEEYVSGRRPRARRARLRSRGGHDLRPARPERSRQLVHRPQVLFLDEPTTGLDPEARVELWREIERLAGEEQMTILLTTHYLEEADRLASRLAIVDRGRIVTEGTPEQLKSELRGDTVQVELAAASNGAAVAALQHLPGLSGLSVDGRLLRARVDNGAAAIPPVLAALERSGLQVASATIARPSLDDVYLRYAGRSFEQADTDNREEAA